MNDKSTVFFTSDTHFNHESIIHLSSRPFASAADMEDSMVAKWNAVVRKCDTVYHLGDFALTWSRDTASVDAILSKLNGQKFLIKGNHDRDAVVKSRHWQEVYDYREIKVGIGDANKQRIVMFHYPLRSWNQMSRGAWMLHGHSHGNLTDIGGCTMDVGVDCNSFTPVSLAEVSQYMSGRGPICVDHHISC